MPERYYFERIETWEHLTREFRLCLVRPIAHRANLTGLFFQNLSLAIHNAKMLDRPKQTQPPRTAHKSKTASHYPPLSGQDITVLRMCLGWHAIVILRAI
jgi:hypothetical protein